MTCEAAVVVERSNSFISNIDWIARYRGFETAWRHSFSTVFRFVFGHVYSVDREASIDDWLRMRMRDPTFVNSLHINRFFLAHAREASINIYIQTYTDIIHYRSTFTDYRHTHRHNTLQIWSFSNMPLFRGLMKIDRLLRSIREDTSAPPCI